MTIREVRLALLKAELLLGSEANRCADEACVDPVHAGYLQHRAQDCTEVGEVLVKMLNAIKSDSLPPAVATWLEGIE